MSKEKDIGRSKLAFDAQRENLWLLDPNDMIVVGLDTSDGLEHPLVNHRVLKMKGQGLDEAMVLSVMKHGVLEPVIVRKNGSVTEVVIGRNRTLWAREANRRIAKDGGVQLKVRCVQRKNNEDKSLTGAIETENSGRRDDDPLTKARNAARLIERGMSKKEVSVEMCVSEEVLNNLLKLPELSDRMQKAIEAGAITATAAATFSDMSHEAQSEILDNAEKLGITISVPEARRQKTQRSNVRKGKSKDAVPVRGKGVSVGVLRKVAEDVEFVDKLSPDAKKLFSWVIGEGSYRTVTGLADALRRIGQIE